MSLDPLLFAPSPIPLHAILAIAALILGVWQLFAAKGTARHRLFGWLWIALLAYVAISGLFIHRLRLVGAFSPIHLLSLYALVLLARGVMQVRRGRVAAHGATMTSLFWYALVVAGAFTFFPGRIMWVVATGG